MFGKLRLEAGEPLLVGGRHIGEQLAARAQGGVVAVAVLRVARVEREDEAVEVANGTSFGLGSYVFTTDPAQAERIADKIDAGMVYVNIVLADSPELPFGGVKRSGYGRELSDLGIKEFVNQKLVVVRQ